MSGEGKVVCVTGASGYVASWIVKLLLQRGYTVKATVRNPNDPKKVEHLLSLEGANERLHLLAANLLEEGSFDAAVEGCEGVFHTASPFFLHDAKDPEAELLDPAVKGTLNVLNSCAKFSSIKRVVLTSSTAAVACNGKPLSAEVVVDESWFSNADFCRKINAWYILSKTMAEEAAWNFVKEKGIDMVTINPGMIIGPLLQPTLNTSAATIAGLFGSEICPNMTFPWVHVKDVATAHILALEVPSANGRYCVSEIVTSLSEIVKVLREIYPDAALPEKCAEDENPLSASYQMSNKKAQSLGIDFIPFKTSLKETVESLKEKGFVKI